MSTTRPSSIPSAKISDRARAIERRGVYARWVSGHPWRMQVPGVHLETLHNPVRYSPEQIEKACAIAQLLDRGKLVLVEPPQR
jgi:hypothetical protein